MGLTARFDKVRSHYDQLAMWYRIFWGPHVHHGYWEKNETPFLAQQRLVERLAEKTGVKPHSRVLDVGCGTGGSSIWLAKQLNCSVVGINLSPAQIHLAEQSARMAHVRDVAFYVKDARRLDDIPSRSFDVVWVIECSEHLEDKQAFFAACSRLLKPGGRLAVCAWLSGSRPDIPLLKQICHSMLCHPFGGMDDYKKWMTNAGLKVTFADDITDKVQKTWRYCLDYLKNPVIRSFLRICGDDIRRFAWAFPLMQRAYASGSLAYGMLAAIK